MTPLRITLRRDDGEDWPSLDTHLYGSLCIPRDDGRMMLRLVLRFDPEPWWLPTATRAMVPHTAEMDMEAWLTPRARVMRVFMDAVRFLHRPDLDVSPFVPLPSSAPFAPLRVARSVFGVVHPFLTRRDADWPRWRLAGIIADPHADPRAVARAEAMIEARDWSLTEPFTP